MEREILAHYEAGIEGPRLVNHAGILARARTMDLLARHLPALPARVLDVGGAPNQGGFNLGWSSMQASRR